MAVIMDGRAVAAAELAGVRARVEILRASGTLPRLDVIIVGDDPASQIYVRNKGRTCAQNGIISQVHQLPGDSTQQQLIEQIELLNADPAVHGILVQSPLPAHIDEGYVVTKIDRRKDVDAFHPYNVGKVMIGDYRFLPCTPAGIIALLKYYKIEISGRQCVVVGRSNIVGKPMTMLLLHENGTVTMCHSLTTDLGSITRSADILVCAVGKAGLITGDMVKAGAAVIDVGMNRGADGKLCGDVVFAEVEPKASFITPVPGGVGPMTIAMLLKNTLTAAERLSKGEQS